MEIKIKNLEFEQVGINPEFILVKCTSELKDFVKHAEKEREKPGHIINKDYLWILDAFENWTYFPSGEAIIGGDYDSHIRYSGGCGWTDVESGYIAFNKVSGKFVPYEAWRHLKVLEADEIEKFDKDYLRKKAELKSKLKKVKDIVKIVGGIYNDALTIIKEKLTELDFVERR